MTSQKFHKFYFISINQSFKHFNQPDNRSDDWSYDSKMNNFYVLVLPPTVHTGRRWRRLVVMVLRPPCHRRRWPWPRRVDSGRHRRPPSKALEDWDSNTLLLLLKACRRLASLRLRYPPDRHLGGFSDNGGLRPPGGQRQGGQVGHQPTFFDPVVVVKDSAHHIRSLYVGRGGLRAKIVGRRPGG